MSAAQTRRHRSLSSGASCFESSCIPSQPLASVVAYPFEGEPPLLQPPGRSFEWVRFEVFSNHLNARIVAALLENEWVPCFIEASASFPGSAVLWVPRHLYHRARWLTRLPPPSDAELEFLATGELGAVVTEP